MSILASLFWFGCSCELCSNTSRKALGVGSPQEDVAGNLQLPDAADQGSKVSSEARRATRSGKVDLLVVAPGLIPVILHDSERTREIAAPVLDTILASESRELSHLTDDSWGWRWGCLRLRLWLRFRLGLWFRRGFRGTKVIRLCPGCSRPVPPRGRVWAWAWGSTGSLPCVCGSRFTASILR